MAPRESNEITIEQEENDGNVPRRRLMGRRAQRLTGARVPKNERRRRADLAGEVRRRDGEIATLLTGRRADREALDRAREEMEEMRRIYEADMRLHSKRAETLRMENEGLKAEIDVLTCDFNAEAVIKTYADLMKSKGSLATSEYSTRLQSELCKAAHRIEVLNEQVKIAKDTCDEKIENLEEDLAQMAHEKGQRESSLLKEKRALHGAKRAEVEAYEKILRQKQSTITDLEEKLEVAESSSAFDASSNSDSSLALNSFKQQLDVLSLEKENGERELRQKLKRRDETILLLREVNAVNDNHLELLRGDIEKSKPNEKVNENIAKTPAVKEDQSAAAILVLMNSLSKVTGNLEGDVHASLQRKRRLIDSLGHHDIDDQVSALPDVVEWNATKSVSSGRQSMVRAPSMLSVMSEVA